MSGLVAVVRVLVWWDPLPVPRPAEVVAVVRDPVSGVAAAVVLVAAVVRCSGGAAAGSVGRAAVAVVRDPLPAAGRAGVLACWRVSGVVSAVSGVLCPVSCVLCPVSCVRCPGWWLSCGAVGGIRRQDSAGSCAESCGGVVALCCVLSLAAARCSVSGVRSSFPHVTPTPCPLPFSLGFREIRGNAK